MELFPAIDMVRGKAVRLLHGDYEQMTVYNDNPLAVAEDFVRCGARNIHMVDLEGAKTGETPNIEIVRSVCRNTPLFVEVGGGVRSEQVIGRYLDAGVGRVILGTAAVMNPALLERAVALYGDKIAVSVDVKDGFVAIHGWTITSGVTLNDFMLRLTEVGVKTIICTDISRDGAMRGTNVALYQQMKAKYTQNVIASGGVSSMEDVKALKDSGIYGAIIGKAYYTGAIDLKKALEEAE